MREPVLSHGGCGSSSLRECIELLNNTERKAPATCHSGAKMENRSAPPQVMSPNVKEQSPDPYMFNSTIWVRHDHEASARVHEDPMDRLHDRVCAMEHNLETLRTRNSGGRSSRCARHP